MHEHESDHEQQGEDVVAYEAPVVEDLECVDGPAVTAAAKSVL
ncbi:unannotated protein [freshwater metagenome]|uniref:Unannotated protein n=1 Tax=freshwater metagenome TaxID=449393 RepID=A0A6J7EQ71_9ZZZZ